jgi:CSLREA domain-containing protein
MTRALLLALPLVLMMPAPAARADGASFVVTSTADLGDSNVGDGTCASQEGHCTLRAAVEEAMKSASGAAVALPAGTFALATPLVITSPVSIRGRGASTVLDARNGSGVAAATAATLSLSALAVRGATTVDDSAAVLSATDSDLSLTDVEIGGAHGGGALQVAGGSVALVRTTVRNSDGAEGAALHAVHADVTITSSTFRANTATGDGGALFLSYPSKLAISDSTFEGNTALGSGGAVYLEGRGRGTKDLSLSGTFTGNAARSAGGGVFVRTTSNGIKDATLAVDGATFTQNSAGVGGALAVSDGTVSITGGTFAANEARTGAGGAITAAGELTVSRATFERNSAAGAGGAIASLGLISVSTSSFTSNAAGTAGGALALQGYAEPTVASSPFHGNTAGGAPQAVWRGGAGLKQSSNTLDSGQEVLVDAPARKLEKVSLTSASGCHKRSPFLASIATALVLLMAGALVLQRRRGKAAT